MRRILCHLAIDLPLDAFYPFVYEPSEVIRLIKPFASPLPFSAGNPGEYAPLSVFHRFRAEPAERLCLCEFLAFPGTKCNAAVFRFGSFSWYGQRGHGLAPKILMSGLIFHEFYC